MMLNSSIIFIFISSVIIVFSLLCSASVLGVTLFSFRLSFVGSLAYELLAAEMSVSGAGYDSLSQFITTNDIANVTKIMYVMGISIIGGIVFMIFFGKKVQMGMLNYQQTNKEWGTLAM